MGRLSFTPDSCSCFLGDWKSFCTTGRPDHCATGSVRSLGSPPNPREGPVSKLKWARQAQGSLHCTPGCKRANVTVCSVPCTLTYKAPCQLEAAGHPLLAAPRRKQQQRRAAANTCAYVCTKEPVQDCIKTWPKAAQEKRNGAAGNTAWRLSKPSHTTHWAALSVCRRQPSAALCQHCLQQNGS